MATQEVLDLLVSEGHAKWIDAKVTVEVPGKTDKVVRPFQKFVALDTEGCLGFCDGKEKPEFDEEGEEKRGVNSLVGFWNYASDLYQRQPIRQAVLAEHEGPGKTIEKAVKAMAAALGITEDEAREQVLSARKAKGLPIE